MPGRRICLTLRTCSDPARSQNTSIALHWYYHHALGLPDKRTAALALGEALHTVTTVALRIKVRNQVAP